MTAEELFKIIENFDLSLLDNSEFQEDAVREEIVNPIIKGLGYSSNKPNQIIRSRKLPHPWVYIGSKQKKIYIIPDFILEVNGKPVWILDAKSPSEAIIKSSNVEQAYSYAVHRDVRVNFFALCNGKEFALYDIREANPVLYFPIKEISQYWKSLKKILSPENTVFDKFPEKGEELDNSLEIHEYDFNRNVAQSLQNNYSVINNYPVVYMLSDERDKEMYIGETTNVNERMLTHLERDVKNRPSKLHLITSSKFHNSATADLKSKLIMYVSADGQYRLLNENIGLCNHNYFEKEGLYKDIFKLIWDKLKAIGISRHSIEEIDNSPLFKYSPYKNLTHDQIKGLLAIMKSLLNESYKSTIVEGGAGTGKTVIAIFLFKLLNSDNEDFNFKEFCSDEMRIV
jgi:predicted GIY-YIG superfamily endonuclease